MTPPRLPPGDLAAGVGVLGLVLAPAVWLVFQQGAGALTYFACPAAGPPLGPLLGLLALAACAFGGRSAWRVAHAQATTSARRVLGWIGCGATALFALASALVSLAMLLIPPCAR
jgi:hypothetical protein